MFQIFLNMGVTGISVTKTLKSTLYEFQTEKIFIMNGKSIDLSNYSVILEEGMISLSSNPSLKLTLLDDQLYIVKPNHSGLIESQDYFKSTGFNILMFFMKEMITSDKLKINAMDLLDDKLSQKSSGCSFWETYYVYSTGGSRSVSESNLDSQTELEESAGEDVEGCRKIGEPDSSCVWENHGCVTTQAYCCD